MSKSIIIKFETKPDFVPITSSNIYEFTQVGKKINGEFDTLSRIDKQPIFKFNDNDVKRVNPDFNQLHLKGYQILSHHLVTSLEDNRRSFENWTTFNNRSIEIINELGYTREDILDDSKYKRIIRDLKLNNLINE